jgi:hypothetical protein
MRRTYRLLHSHEGSGRPSANIQSIPSITEILRVNSVPFNNELHAGKAYK